MHTEKGVFLVQKIVQEVKRKRQVLRCVSLVWCLFCHPGIRPRWHVPYICDAHLARCGHFGHQLLRIDGLALVRGDKESNTTEYVGVVTGIWMDDDGWQRYSVYGGESLAGDYFRYQLDAVEKP